MASYKEIYLLQAARVPPENTWDEVQKTIFAMGILFAGMTDEEKAEILQRQYKPGDEN